MQFGGGGGRRGLETGPLSSPAMTVSSKTILRYSVYRLTCNIRDKQTKAAVENLKT